MIEFEEAYGLVLKETRTLGREVVRIEEAIGRVLTEEITSDMDVPPFNKSAMDGYALSSREVKDIPMVLKVKSRIKAGKYYKGKLGEKESLKIMSKYFDLKARKVVGIIGNNYRMPIYVFKK